MDVMSARIAFDEVVPSGNPELTSVEVPDALHRSDTDSCSLEVLNAYQDV